MGKEEDTLHFSLYYNMLDNYINVYEGILRVCTDSL